MKLEEGEVFCPKCNGGGSYPYKFVKLEDPKYCRCNKCLGTGKLDWIEVCMGKRDHWVKINPYDTLTLPILRVYYPKLIAKDLVSYNQ